MTYARPITAAHFPLFARMRAAGMDFCELLVPEPGEVDPAEAGARRARRRPVAGPRRAGQRRARPRLRRRGGARGRRGLSAHAASTSRVACGARSSAARSTARRWCSPAGRRARSTRGAARTSAVDRVVEGLQQGRRPMPPAHGVRLAVEPLNRFETDFCNTARPGLRAGGRWSTARRSASCSTRST